MSSSQSRRVAAFVGPVLVGAFFMASCGAADDAATQSTIDLSASSTAFIVRPPATTEPPDTEVAAGEVVTGEQEYVVQPNDTPIGVANSFNVPLDDLIAYNEWTPGQFAFPGETIKIPPGGTAPGAETASAASDDETAAAGTIPDAGDNCAPGTYVIVAGDLPGRVADNFDVTLEALNAANVNTNGYTGFVVGIEIVIPAKADC